LYGVLLSKTLLYDLQKGGGLPPSKQAERAGTNGGSGISRFFFRDVGTDDVVPH